MDLLPFPCDKNSSHAISTDTEGESEGHIFPNLLSEFIYTRTYSRWVPDKGRRETWEETVSRYFDFISSERHIPSHILRECWQAVLKMEIVPSMRALWSAGEAARRDNTTLYNCSFVGIDSLRSFSEALHILMCGTGVGFSVENRFVGNLPVVGSPTGKKVPYQIEDSTEGWADALYFGLTQWFRGNCVDFDYSLIRDQGAILKIKGGRSSGPDPLRRLMEFAQGIVLEAGGRKVRSIEAHDIMCHIAEIVMVGGFRRAALISISDPDDEEMRHAKDWSRGSFPSIRYMANNSAYWVDRPSPEKFRREWESLVESKSGERGFIIDSWHRRSDRPKGMVRTNPCVTGDTRVMTQDGLLKIEDLSKMKGDGDYKVSIDCRFNEGMWASAYSDVGSHAFKTDTREVFKLRTMEGYTLRLTADHQVMTSDGWVEAQHLQLGDIIHLANTEGMFGTHGNADVGLLAGWATGDGCLLVDGDLRICFHGVDHHLILQVLDATERLTGKRPLLNTSVDSNQKYFECDALREYLGQVIEDKFRVPEFVWRGTEDCQRSYLSALFSADGEVSRVDKLSETQEKCVRLTLSKLDLLHDIQVLLLNFGIASRIYEDRHTAGYRDFPDGRGGYEVHFCNADHELVISGSNVRRFWEQFGFICQGKQARLAMLNSTCIFPNESFTARFRSLTPDGVEDVYDMTIPVTHSFIANGLVVHNCGEIGLRFLPSEDPWSGEGGAGQMCNLTAAVMRDGDTIEMMEKRVRLATWLGVIQSSFTYFPYLRSGWKEICEQDRLLGVDITGQCDNPRLSGDPEAMSRFNRVAIETAAEAAAVMGINMPVAVTCGKPSGNCRPWNGLVTTKSGIYTLQDLFEDHPDGHEWAPLQREVRVNRGTLAEPRVLRTYDNGEADLVKITMNYGLVIESTPEHKWFVANRVIKGKPGLHPVGEWVAAQDIQPCDVLGIRLGDYEKAEHSPLISLRSRAWRMRQDVGDHIHFPTHLNEDICWMLGYLWGDGCQFPGGFRFRFSDEHAEHLEKLQRMMLEQFGIEADIHPKKNSKAFVLEFASIALWHWLICNGVLKYFAGNIDIIPRVVRESARDDIIAFMAGLLDSDGWCGRKRGKKRPQGPGYVMFTNLDSTFSQHFQDVAWTVGLGLGRSLNWQKKRQIYLLECSVHVIPSAFEALVRNSVKAQALASQEDFPGWEWALSERKGSNYPGRVKAVEPGGRAPTFDIEVELDHWYYAGAVKSHNSSQMLDCASGFHPRYAPYYFRHVRISSSDPLFSMARDVGIPVFKENGQEHLKDSDVSVWVIRFPVKAPEGAVFRGDETALDQCNRYLHVIRTWCGERGHNQSATIYVKEHEWEEVGQWVYDHFDEITGLSFLPYDSGNYRLAPYQEITREEYEKALLEMPSIDFSLLSAYEKEDRGEGSVELACMGGSCLIDYDVDAMEEARIDDTK